MSDKKMDPFDRLILNKLQTGISLTSRPFNELGNELGLEEKEVTKRLRKLKERGVIRRIGAVLDSRQLGFSSTLVAMQVPAEKILAAAEKINSFPEVTHNYLRDNRWNMWFTLIAPSNIRIKEILDEIKSSIGCPLISLPAKKVFKIRAEFIL